MAMTVCPWRAELELLRCKSESVFRVGFRGEACRGADRDMGFRGEDYEVRRGAEMGWGAGAKLIYELQGRQEHESQG